MNLINQLADAQKQLSALTAAKQTADAAYVASVNTLTVRVAELEKSNAELSAKAQGFEAKAAELVKASADLAAANTLISALNSKVADFDSTLDAKASAKAQLVLAASGAPPITTTATAMPATQKGESAALTGLARVKAAIREELRLNKAA